jgi:hypothetical protein
MLDHIGLDGFSLDSLPCNNHNATRLFQFIVRSCGIYMDEGLVVGMQRWTNILG